MTVLSVTVATLVVNEVKVYEYPAYFVTVKWATTVMVERRDVAVSCVVFKTLTGVEPSSVRQVLDEVALTATATSDRIAEIRNNMIINK